MDVAVWPDLDDNAELCAALHSPERLRALEHSGLGAAPDPEMDFYAHWTCRALGVPAAAVTLLTETTQYLPGAVGLNDATQAGRSVPVSASLCQWVIASAQPLVLVDTAEDRRTRYSPAVIEDGIRAYAGIPLFDVDGHVLGSLCALDHAPRLWTETDIETLTNIARACATELRLRLTRHDAADDEARRDRSEAGHQRAFDRSQTLLTASQAFTDTVTVADVRSQIHELLTAELAPSHVEIAVLDNRERAADEPSPGTTRTWGPDSPIARVLTHRQVLHYPDRASFDGAFPGPDGDRLRVLGLASIAVVPLPTADRILGALVIGWARAHVLDPTDLLTIATLAGYAGHALGRARRLSHRNTVAHEMQAAMLTELPESTDLPMAARYLPADSRETVGGDWYDAANLVDPDRPDDHAIVLSIGDIIGHSLSAVTLMGQVRSMLRQAAADHPGGPPSRIFEAFENANDQFELGAAGTAVLAHLRRSGSSDWSITWTNAGHPPPLLLLPDGTHELLDTHDTLFGFRLMKPGERTDHYLRIPPGSLLFLYTDGLVERRNSDLDAGTQRLLDLLDTVRAQSPEQIVDAVIDQLAGGAHEDDIVAFAVRIPD